MFAGQAWNRRRLIIFTEYEDTRRWLERRLKEALGDTDRADERIATSPASPDRTGARRSSSPSTRIPKEPLRILLCTDAAREGINLQTRCTDLVHFDLPWNPSRLEQRNGRIDRKLQPAETVTCRYFVYAQRRGLVLEALVRKTETISEQLGSAGQVLGERITKRLAVGGITRRQAEALARDIAEERRPVGRARSPRHDRRRRRTSERLLREVRMLAFRRAGTGAGARRHRAGRSPSVVATALARDGFPLDRPRRSVCMSTTLPDRPRPAGLCQGCRLGRPFRRSGGSGRAGARQLADWRAKRPVRAIAFHPAILPDGRDAAASSMSIPSTGSSAGCSPASSPTASSPPSRGGHIRPRCAAARRVGRAVGVVRAGAARLHEEIFPVTALWTKRRDASAASVRRARPADTINELEDALKTPRVPPRRRRYPRRVARISSTSSGLEDRSGRRRGQEGSRGNAARRIAPLKDLLEQQRPHRQGGGE